MAQRSPLVSAAPPGLARCPVRPACTIPRTPLLGGPKITRLIISEKDNSAKKIAGFISEGKVTEESKGRQKWYRFKVAGGVDAVAMGLRGHILGVDFEEGNSSWDWAKLDGLIDAPLRKTPQETGVITQLKALAKEADEVVIATDYDREGELIGVEALQVLASALTKGASKRFDFTKDEIIEALGSRPIRRAKYSALTKKEIDAAFTDPMEMDWHLAQAAETRQDIDLIWGAALTRYASLVSGRRGQRFLSIGRVQSPTLAILVDREAERRAFRPESYWQVKVDLRKGSDRFQGLHKVAKFKAESEADSAVAAITESAVVTDVVPVVKKVQPPAPFHTTAFLSAAASLGFSPSAAMNVAESLYMGGYISYPRVDNTVYPESLDLMGIVDEVGVGEFAPLRKYVLSLDKITPTRGKKLTTDHPPIHPTGKATRMQIDERQWKIYELVVRRFFATLSPLAIQENLKVELDSGGEAINARGTRLVEEGFLFCYPYSRSRGEELPALAVGDTVEITKKELLAKETQPPTRYGAGRLIELMESLGLGTKATRHEIINTVVQRFYAYDNPLKPSLLGETVVDAMRPDGGQIFSPDMTADLEAKMDEIAQGNTDKETVIAVSRQMLHSVMTDLIEKREEISPIFWANLETLGTCPKCGGKVKMKKAKKSGKRFAGCSTWPECDWTAPLPQFGEVLPLKKGEDSFESCDDCGSPRVMVLTKGKRPWDTCINMQCPGRERAKAEREKAEKEKKATEEQPVDEAEDADDEDAEGTEGTQE